MIFSLGYVLLGFSPYKMPVFYDAAATNENEESSRQPKIHFWKPLLFLTFFYYVISCGIERIYQPMAYTYGICGPLKLLPSKAVIIDQCYNGGFMAGRLSGIFVAKFLQPRTMIITSLFFCMLAAILLVVVGGSSVIGVYVGTCKPFFTLFVRYESVTCLTEQILVCLYLCRTKSNLIRPT